MTTLVWFRDDLRVTDNTALYNATQRQDSVVALYIISPEEWQVHDVAACRVDFILRNLQILQSELNAVNIPLITLTVKKVQDIAGLIASLCEQHDIKRVFANEQYEIDESRRDQAVEKQLAENGIDLTLSCDQVILSPGEVLTQAGEFYTVFTPFKRSWYRVLNEKGGFKILPKPEKQAKLDIISTEIPDSVSGFESNIDAKLWPAGEMSAHTILEDFAKNKISEYNVQRDIPSTAGTSTISPYLASGVVSARQCIQVAKENMQDMFIDDKSGAAVWVSEIIWREFYKHILFAFPRVCMNRAFRLETEALPWDNNKEKFSAWCEGRTGYPLVDAAMRQLNTIGWMHNRLRMLAAMFLTKDLMIDWRWGESYFMRHLIDGDFSANNGGWQWSTGCGTDAAPYFRIFNPITQSRKFDPDAIFIKQYCPELASLDVKAIHEPNSMERAMCGYPGMIVDHKQARIKFLEAYKKYVSKK